MYHTYALILKPEMPALVAGTHAIPNPLQLMQLAELDSESEGEPESESRFKSPSLQVVDDSYEVPASAESEVEAEVEAVKIPENVKFIEILGINVTPQSGMVTAINSFMFRNPDAEVINVQYIKSRSS